MTKHECLVTPASRQEAFDAAARHLLGTRKPSIQQYATPGNPNFSCSYAGSGCALRPFAPLDPQLLAYWDRCGAVTDFPEGDLPDFIAADLEFYASLQEAHDVPEDEVGNIIQPTRSDPAEWFEAWQCSMQRIASKYGLSPAVLEEAAQ